MKGKFLTTHICPISLCLKLEGYVHTKSAHQ